MTVDYEIRDGFEAMDFQRVTAMLTTAPWAAGVQIDDVVRGASHSALVVGAFDPQGRQIGYARVISDLTVLAYVLDVFVDADCRGQGIGQAMVRHILACPRLQRVRRWLLFTEDAHGVYEKFGFKLTERAYGLMEITKPRPASAP